MKKLIIILSILSIIYIISNYKEDYIVIPSNSIRFRIIPNSNSLLDLSMKEKTKEIISTSISKISTSNNINESRINIINEIPYIKENINNLFKENNYNKEININYGLNYFPEKIYKGVKYPSGDYESLVIEIGNSSGDNYWCVLYPPLCMIEDSSTTEVEYKFFVKEVINKLFKS